MQNQFNIIGRLRNSLNEERQRIVSISDDSDRWVRELDRLIDELDAEWERLEDEPSYWYRLTDAPFSRQGLPSHYVFALENYDWGYLPDLDDCEVWVIMDGSILTVVLYENKDVIFVDHFDDSYCDATEDYVCPFEF